MKDRNGNKIRVGEEVRFSTYCDDNFESIGTVVHIYWASWRRDYAHPPDYEIAYIVRDNEPDDLDDANGPWMRQTEEVERA